MDLYGLAPRAIDATKKFLRHPIRSAATPLRKQSVVTLLALAGLIVSAAGLLIVIGIGNVQIQASRGGPSDLFTDPWFDVGLFLAGLAILFGGLAISASVFQARAKREFPDIDVQILSSAWANSVVRPPSSNMPATAVGIMRYGIRIVNREVDRTAHISFRLWWPLPSGPMRGVAPFIHVVWDAKEASALVAGGFPASPLPTSVPISAGAVCIGDLLFECWPPFNSAVNPGAVTPHLILYDHVSNKEVGLEPTIEHSWNLSNWLRS